MRPESSRYHRGPEWVGPYTTGDAPAAARAPTHHPGEDQERDAHGRGTQLIRIRQADLQAFGEGEQRTQSERQRKPQSRAGRCGAE